MPLGTIFVSPGVINFYGKLALLEFVENLAIDEIIFSSFDDIDLSLVDITELDSLWIVRITTQHRLSYGLILGSEI